MATFYHGTSARYAEQIRENGMVPPPGHGRGVRVTRTVVEAASHARAWSAYMLLRDGLGEGAQYVDLSDEKRLAGIIVVCSIMDLPRIRRDSADVLRVKFVMPFEVRRMIGPIRYPEFGTLDDEEPREPFFDALDEWERLTDKRLNMPPRRRARRS